MSGGQSDVVAHCPFILETHIFLNYQYPNEKKFSINVNIFFIFTFPCQFFNYNGIDGEIISHDPQSGPRDIVVPQ